MGFMPQQMLAAQSILSRQGHNQIRQPILANMRSQDDNSYRSLPLANQFNRAPRTQFDAQDEIKLHETFERSQITQMQRARQPSQTESFQMFPDQKMANEQEFWEQTHANGGNATLMRQTQLGTWGFSFTKH